MITWRSSLEQSRAAKFRQWGSPRRLGWSGMHRQARAAALCENGNAPWQPANGARYVAIVSDGSARWAQAHGRPIGDGHEAAADTAIDRILDAIELGVHELT